MIEFIVAPVLALGGMSLIFGIGLGIAGVKFKVEEDPNLPLIRDALPGANCGGCGFAGCDAFAQAVLDGKAAPTGCPVGGAAVASAIGEVLGIQVKTEERKCAYIRCAGDCNKSASRYLYAGLNDCGAAMQLAAGGSKECSFGCLGNGSCVTACHFDAIDIVDGIARINSEKCIACGQCVDACPKKLIEMVPYASTVRVACHSTAAGKIVRSQCTVGCIGCKLCEKACQYDAIHVKDFLATIDYTKCTMCGACVEKCPTKAIAHIESVPQQSE